MPANDAQDQISRLEVVVGAVKPYVLDISWEDLDGKDPVSENSSWALVSCLYVDYPTP